MRQEYLLKIVLHGKRCLTLKNFMMSQIVWEKSLIVKNEKNAVSLKREGCLYWGSRGEGTKGNGAKWDEILVKSLRFCQKMDFLKMLCYTAKKRLHR